MLQDFVIQRWQPNASQFESTFQGPEKVTGGKAFLNWDKRATLFASPSLQTKQMDTYPLFLVKSSIFNRGDRQQWNLLLDLPPWPLSLCTISCWDQQCFQQNLTGRKSRSKTPHKQPQTAVLSLSAAVLTFRVLTLTVSETLSADEAMLC